MLLYMLIQRICLARQAYTLPPLGSSILNPYDSAVAEVPPAPHHAVDTDADAPSPHSASACQ